MRLAPFVACTLAALALVGCRSGPEGQVANCAPSGVKEVKQSKDPSHSLIVCKDGRVFSVN